MAHKLAFAIDIDSTLVQSHQQLPGSSQALNLLTQQKIPYLLVTNNISRSQQTKADELNKILDLEAPIRAQQIILNTTPLIGMTDWSSKIVLIVMRDNEQNQRLPIPGIPRYITISEYCIMFPNTVPLSRRQKDSHYEQTVHKVQARLGMESISQQQLQIDAIMILNCPLRWEECYQVIMDLLSCPRGSIKAITEYKYIANHIPVISALNDMHFKTKEHPLPRILVKPFNEGLCSIYRQIYGQELKMLHYGKPQRNTYIFVDKYIQQQYGHVQKVVMIGDNDATDILGAYNYGWDSVLVTTGISKTSHKATWVCPNVLQAIAKYGITSTANGEGALASVSANGETHKQGQQ